MKKIIVLSLLLSIQIATAQKQWFTTYADSIALVKDANAITKSFTKDIKKCNKNVAYNIKTVLHTTPYLIYFYKDAANIPLWEQVIPEQKQFFYEIAGSEAEGKKFFGLFFNGFYLPHELGHAYEYAVKGETIGSYKGEYFANTVAILWWKKHHREKELKECYEAAKKCGLNYPILFPKVQPLKNILVKTTKKPQLIPMYMAICNSNNL